MKKTPTLLSYCATALTACLLTTSSFAFGGGGSDPSEEYADNGSYSTTSESLGFNCTMYRPRNLDNNHAIILWGNGTGASPATYASGLRHWASYGFVVVAADTSNAGSGEEMLDCLDRLGSSSIRNQLDFSKVGASGHSQGGGGTIAAGRDSRITATAPMQPYTVSLLGHRSIWNRQQVSPMLLLGSSGDSIATPRSNQDNVFDDANVAVFYAQAQGPSHFEATGDMGVFSGISTAWFLYKLNGDNDAADLFQGSNCGMCDAPDWDIEVKGNP